MNEIIRQKINSYLTGFDEIDKENLYNYVLEMIEAEWDAEEMRENLQEYLLEKTQPFVGWLFEELQRHGGEAGPVEVISLKDEEVDLDEDVIMIEPPPPPPRKSVFDRLGAPGGLVAPRRLITTAATAPRRLITAAAAPLTQINGDSTLPQTQTQSNQYTASQIWTNDYIDPHTVSNDYIAPQIRENEYYTPQNGTNEYNSWQTQLNGDIVQQKESYGYIPPQTQIYGAVNKKTHFLNKYNPNNGVIGNIWKKKKNKWKKNVQWNKGRKQVQNLSIIRNELQSRKVSVQSAVPGQSKSVKDRISLPPPQPEASAAVLLNAIKLLLGVYCQKSTEESINLE